MTNIVEVGWQTSFDNVVSTTALDFYSVILFFISSNLVTDRDHPIRLFHGAMLLCLIRESKERHIPE